MISRWSAQIEIDKICDRYEDEWRSGCSKALDAYLEDLDPPVRSQLFQELVLVDRELRISNAETPTWDEYRTYFPAYAKEIEVLRFKWELSTDGGGPGLATETATPVHLARFELLETVGRGAGGVVWKAHDPRLDRHVAIKLPHAGRHWEEAQLSRFFREARAVAKLAHPNIVEIHEIDQFANRPYIVSKFVDGQDLRILLGSTRLTPDQVAKLCRDVADALQHAHDQGIVHRDIKPSNILVDRLRCPYVTDFGLAKDIEHDATATLQGVIIGTPAYMSPEQASAGAVSVDHRTDIYSLGVVLYEALTQRRPFSNHPHSLTASTPRPDPPRPRSIERAIPRDLESICLKAIEMRPEDRYQTAADFAADLQRFLAGEQVQASGYGPIATTWRQLKRHPARLAIVCLLALSATAASAAGFLARQNDELRGLQMVELTSDPPGATLAVVPIDDVTYEPNVDRKSHLSGTTPFHKKLAPGNYLVVAALPDGRFHEVYRHVPKQSDSLPAGYKYLYWDVAEDGSIKLPPIVIPSVDSTVDMAFASQDDSRFYMDCHEFTVGEYQALMGHLPNDLRWQSVPADYAVTVSFHDAMVIAERLGKRLPTAGEYAIAVAHASVGDEIPAQTTAQSALTLSLDATKTSPPIVGLRSNLDEWTMTRPSRLPAGRNEKPLPIAGLTLFQVVQPGNLVSKDQEHGLNETRQVVAIRPQYLVSPDLGFRCVRSAKPRFIEK